jgi:hypothetical protein
MDLVEAKYGNKYDMILLVEQSYGTRYDRPLVASVLCLFALPSMEGSLLSDCVHVERLKALCQR